MIKHINHQNVSTTPFVAAKVHSVFNIQGDDALEAEPSVYADGTLISLDYVDYNIGDPRLSRDCNIALEQQGFDALGYQEGITGSGVFNPDSDPKNVDGTYKSLVHRQIKNAFYNSYQNPTAIFGVEHIDFPLSKTLRNLADEFRMFSIPRLVCGDKIQPKSVKLYDTLLDDNVEIFDDGYQNLIAGHNLFSKVQEVRIWPFGTQQNEYFPGTSSAVCPVYDSFFITNPASVAVDYGTCAAFMVSGSGTPRPLVYQWYSGSTALTDNSYISGSNNTTLSICNVDFSVEGCYYVVGHNSASAGATSSVACLSINIVPPIIISHPQDQTVYRTFSASFAVTSSGYPPMMYQWISGSTFLTDDARITGSNMTGSFSSSLQINNVDFADSGSYRVFVTNVLGSVMSNTALLTVLDNVIPTSGSDTASFDPLLVFGSALGHNYTEIALTSIGVGLSSGSLATIIIPITGSRDTASIDVGFDNGAIIDQIIKHSGSYDTASIDVGFGDGAILELVKVMTGSRDTASIDIGFGGGEAEAPIVMTQTGADSSVASLLLISGSLQWITASFIATTLAGTAPLIVTFLNYSTPGTFTRYNWNPSGSFFTASLNTFTYTKSGSYKVALMGFSASYSSSLTQSNYIAIT